MEEDAEVERLREAAIVSYEETRRAWAAWLEAQDNHRRALGLLADARNAALARGTVGA